MATNTTTIKFVGQFDTSQITKGLQDIKKQVTNANISDELKKQFEAAFNKLQVNIPALEKLTSKEDFNLKDIEALQKLLKEVTKDWENLNKVTDQIDLSKTFSAKDIEKINNLDKQIKQTEDNIKKARKELVDAFAKDTTININSENVSNALTELFTVKPNEIDGKFKEIQEQFAQGVQQTQTELENKLKGANIQKTSSQILEYFFGKNSGVEFVGKIGPVKDQLNLIIRTYREAQQKGDIVGVAEQIQKLNEVLTDTANFKFPEGYQLFGLPTQKDLDTLNQIGEVLKKVKELAEGKEVFFTEEEANLLDLIRQRTEAHAKAAEEATKKQEQFGNGIKNTGKELENLNGKVDEGATDLRRLQRQGEALEQTFGSLARRIESSVSALAVFNKSTQIIRSAIKSVEDLDAAFTQIAIVSEQSGEAAWKMFDSFNSLAKQYSITTKDLTEGAKLFYQQGLNAADTMKMVEASTVSAALGEVTMTEAANTLTAAIQGYNESAAVAMDYTDKIAMVGAVSAADFNELSTAMEKTASSAYTAGIDFDHLLGYLGKMIEVTREAPANLGTAMKTIIARFEDMKKDPMAILEDGVSANKVEAALATIGIALRNSEGEFRALQDVMDELGMKWSSLTRNQQAYIATVAAGSRQQSRFLALMNNYDRTLDLVIESQNSAGAAAQQYSTYQDSIAAAQARLTASWENFYSKIVDNSIIKVAINGLSSLLEVISKIPPIITAIGASFGALALQNVFKLLKPTNNEISKVASGFRDLYEASKKNAGTMSELVQIAPKMGSGLNLIKTATDGIKESFIGATKATIAFIGKNLATIGSIALVVTAVTGLIYILNSQKRAYEENIKKIKEYQEEANNLTNKTTNAKKLIENYETLASKINRTEEEQSELNNTIQQISSIYPEAKFWVDEYGNSHLENVEILKEEIELEKQLAKDKERSALKQRKQLLEKPLKEWKEEDFNQIGFNSSKVSRYFDARDKYNEYSNLSMGWTQNQLNRVQDYIDNTKLPEVDRLSGAISTLNNIIKQQNLDFELLSKDTASWIEIQDLQEDIQKFKDNMPKTLEDLKNLQNELIESLKRENSTKLSFLDLIYDDNKQGTATAQKIIATKLETFISSLGTDAYNALMEQVGGSDGLTTALQAAIDKVDIDNSIEIKELADKLTTGTLNEEELAKFYELLGITVGDSFANGIEEALEKQKEKIRQDIIDAVQVKFNGNEGGLDLNNLTSSNETLTTMTQMPTEHYNINAAQALELAPAWTKYQEELKKAAETGNFEGIVESIEEISNDFYLTGILKGLFYQAARDGLDDAINGYSDKISEELHEAMNNLSSIMGKDYSKTNTTEAMGYADTFGSGFLDHITSDENGQLTLDTYGQILVYEKEIKDSKEKVNEKVKELNDQYDSMENKESKEAKKLKSEIDSWEKIIGLLDNSDNGLKKILKTTKEIEGSTEDLKKIIADIPDDIGDIASENARALKTSIEIGKEYEDIINLSEKLEKQMKDVGQVDDDVVQELLNYGDVFSDFFIIDENDNSIRMALNGVIDDYAEAAEAINGIAVKRREAQLEIKRQEMRDEANIAEQKADAYDELARMLEEYVGVVIDNNKRLTEDERLEEQARITQQIEGQVTTLNNIENSYTAIQQAAQDMYNNLQSYDKAYWDNIGDPEALKKAMEEAFTNAKAIRASAQFDPLKIIESGDRDNILNAAKTYRQAASGLREYAARLRANADKIKAIDPTTYEKLADKMEKAGKAGDKAGEAIAKAIADAAEAIIKLDNLIDEVKKDLKDITVDYNPFTDLFEAWEHEWDYYYNIKRLLQQIDTQGQYIDNIISADYASAGQRIEAEQAKMGNILAKMAANDTYIEALRAGMSQTAVELMKDYGEYYKVDPTTGQLYQTDKNLNDINELMNERKEEIYNLQKLQNEKENDLALENAKLDALEEEKSAYEDILSTIESQLDKLKDNEDITVDVSGLEKQKAELEAKIEVTDQSIEDAKDKIQDMEDEIQEIEVDITLKDQDFQKLEDYVSDMEDKVSEYEEYWENLNSTIAEQQELLQSLAEMRQGYIDTAISTQQALYDAIVENYQDEINEKKKQYDYLKQLDNDYLRTIKDNISKERQAREDANKQREYQKNVQRAQLLQMDTSGAYRNELADLNKEIESQRQDLYDDLVDRQVEALEKEIEKRHELYDQEVQALEERLAYYQENAIILWEMVNSIVAEGANTMMATLQNTTEYMNSSELAKDEQRKAWEYDVQKTFEGIQNNVITTLDSLVEAGNKFIVEKYPEVGNSLTEYKKVFDDASKAVTDYNNQLISSRGTLNSDTEKATQVFQGVLDSFMTTWNDRTNEFTGYAKNWEDVTNALKEQTSKNLEELESLYDSQGRAIEGAIGSIEDYDESLRNASAEIYQDFIDERERYRNELESFVSQVESDLSAAVSRAATAIEQAAADISINFNNNGGNDNNGNEDTNSGGFTGNEENEGKRYKIEINASGRDLITNEVYPISASLGGYSTPEQAIQAANDYIKRQLSNLGLVLNSRGSLIPIAYAKGGLASFTGPAWLDGTKTNPERVLSPKQTKLFESMVSSLERTANNSNINSTFGSSYNIGDINTTIQVEKLDNDTDINKVARQVEDRIMKSIRNRVTVSVK